MNTINITRKIIACLICGNIVALVASCSDFFESDSESVIKTEGHVYADELEARAGLFGLLQGLQEVGDHYILMGELRGDLMTATENSSQELHDIDELNISADNSFLKEREYYALINDCNYYITHIDTTVTKLNNGKSQKYLYPYLAQAKAIRAWAYMQMALDYGSVTYSTLPFLNADSDDDNAKTIVTMPELVPMLIADLEQALPWAAEGYEQKNNTTDAGAVDPGFSSSVSFESYTARQLMFPLRFILGELYLWQQDYEKAATYYYSLIRDNGLLMSGYANRYNEQGTVVTSRTWTNQFSGFAYADILTAIIFNSDIPYGTSYLYTMAGKDYTIAPSHRCISIFDSQYYFTNRSIEGDTRGLYGTYRTYSDNLQETSAQKYQISKYGYMSASSRYYISPCRTALVYLRWAEAVNRLGKPRLVFYGFLKYGLSAYNLNLYRDRPQLDGELTGESWMNFGQDEDENGFLYQLFRSNTRGFHARGCGNTDMNTTYILEEQPTLQDSILWVEDQLVTELALETAFEGNRFHDLMRIAKRRGDNSYLADKVASKFSDGRRAAVRTKLLDEQNWYLPKSK
ncbi:MAG: RagB/SusD family nutrient uptake outer membrane protein [Prevotella sp.]